MTKVIWKIIHENLENYYNNSITIDFIHSENHYHLTILQKLDRMNEFSTNLSQGNKILKTSIDSKKYAI